MVFEQDGTLREHPLGAARPYVLALEPEHDLPGDYSFATHFSQHLDVRLRLTRDGESLAETSSHLEVYDVRQFGSLYERIVNDLVKPDTERQAPGLPHTYHPWFPVLLIGAQGGALHAGADRRHRRQAPQPRRPRLARAGRAVPRAADRLGVIEAVKDTPATC